MNTKTDPKQPVWAINSTAQTTFTRALASNQQFIQSRKVHSERPVLSAQNRAGLQASLRWLKLINRIRVTSWRKALFQACRTKSFPVYFCATKYQYVAKFRSFPVQSSIMQYRVIFLYIKQEHVSDIYILSLQSPALNLVPWTLSCSRSSWKSPKRLSGRGDGQCGESWELSKPMSAMYSKVPVKWSFEVLLQTGW